MDLLPRMPSFQQSDPEFRDTRFLPTLHPIAESTVEVVRPVLQFPGDAVRMLSSGLRGTNRRLALRALPLTGARHPSCRSIRVQIIHGLLACGLLLEHLLRVLDFQAANLPPCRMIDSASSQSSISRPSTRPRTSYSR